MKYLKNERKLLYFTFSRLVSLLDLKQDRHPSSCVIWTFTMTQLNLTPTLRSDDGVCQIKQLLKAGQGSSKYIKQVEVWIFTAIENTQKMRYLR